MPRLVRNLGMLADLRLPDLPDLELPDLPDLHAFLGEGEEARCPVCAWVEDKVCRPHMTTGDPEECAREIIATRQAIRALPRENRVQEMGKVFARYGIPADARLKPEV